MQIYQEIIDNYLVILLLLPNIMNSYINIYYYYSILLFSNLVAFA